MKKLIGLLTIILLTLVGVSCNSGPGKKLKEAKEQASDIGNIVKNMDDLEEATKENSKRVEELKKITPFTNDKMTGWMPQELNGMKRASYSVSSAIGTSQGDLRFENEAKDKSVTITIIDGAGEVGSNFYSSQVLMMETLKNMSSESDDRTEKVVKRGGNLAYETYYKSENRSTIQVVLEDRFIVSVEGQGLKPDEAWSAIEKLNFKGLI
ncbi:MAG: hypothetical protein WCR12_06420 [Dysgonamonadaceae bacterium]